LARRVSSEPKISAEPERSVRTMVVCWGTSRRSSVSERRVWRSPLEGVGFSMAFGFDMVSRVCRYRIQDTGCRMQVPFVDRRRSMVDG